MRYATLPTGWVARLALALLLALPGPLRAQGGAQGDGPFGLSVRPSDGGVEAELAGVLLAPGIRSSLAAGLPVRLLLVTELWQDRFFDSQQGRNEWSATVQFNPLGESFRLETEDGSVTQASSLEEVDALLSRSVRIPLVPTAPGRYYYLGRTEVEPLALSDLEELRRWLQGDLGPAMDQDTEVGSALGRGLRRLLVRALGLPIQRFQARSPAFDWDG
ncbi:MAG: hypothetical protein EXR92_02165 [Gemmatimonadetes bacterium]|nr:hypothetical protein [Gemmatimonadota bacterium]